MEPYFIVEQKSAENSVLNDVDSIREMLLGRCGTL
jgi:hypothetical protein